MSEAEDQGVKSVVVEDEHMNDGGNVTESQEQGGPVSGCSPVLDHSAVLTTGNEITGGFDLSSKVRKLERSQGYFV